MNSDGDAGWRIELAALERQIPVSPESTASAANEHIEAGTREGDEARCCRARLVLAKIALNDWDLTGASAHIEASRALDTSENDEDSLNFKIVDAELLSKTHQVAAAVAIAGEIRDRTTALYAKGELSEALLRLHWRAVFHLSIGRRDLGQFDLALEELDQLNGIPAPHDDPLSNAMLRANRALPLIDLGRPKEAVAELEIARNAFQDADAVVYQRRVALHLARALAHQGLFSRALAVMKEARLHYEDGAGDGDWHKAVYDLDSARVTLVEVYSLMGESGIALELLMRSLPVVTRWNNLRDVKRVFVMSAELAAESAPEKAVALLESLVALSRDLGDDMALARIVLRMFELAPDCGRDDCFDDAAVIIDKYGSDADVVRLSLLRADRCGPEERHVHLERARIAIQQCSDPNLLWQFHFRTGRSALETGRHADARVSLQAAVQVLRAVWTSIPDERLRIRHRSVHRQVVDDLIGVLLELGLTEELFELIEETYAITLRERIHGVVSPSDWPTVCADLDEIYSEMAAAGPVELEQLQKRASEVEQSRVPGEPEWTVGDKMPIASASIVRPDRSIVYGISGDEVFGLFRVPNKPITLSRHLTTKGKLEDLRLDLELQRRRSELETLQPHAAQLDAITNSVLEELFDLLVATPLKEIGARPNNPPGLVAPNQIVIVPPPGFDDLPFAALRVGGRALIEYVGVCVAPSTALAGWFGGKVRAGRSTLAVGVSSPQLRFPEIEALRIGEVVEGRVLTGQEATIDRVTELVAEYDVIHLATHGMARPLNPWFNGLELGDGWLTTAEISTWRLDGQIFVLSGCDTGQQSAPGHELLGLPRALLAAGAGGVIVAMSDLDDERAADFMAELHRNLAGFGPAEALRQTQVTFAANGPDLRQWASMAYIGGPDREVNVTLV